MAEFVQGARKIKNRHSFVTNKLPLCVAIAALSPFLGMTSVLAGPEGGEVVGGSGSIGQSGNTTTIHQSTSRLAIDWQSYNVGAEETVQYFQPDSSSISLNRILSHQGSEIHGQIIANGTVFLLNPNGVVFGDGAQVNVGGLLAGGLSMDSSEFMNGHFALESIDGTDGYVINQGTLLAATGGSISLVGKQVSNEGLIRADLGRITLASGNKAVLSFDGGLIGVRVSEEILQEELGVDAGVLNSGTIEASGGQVLLSGAASHDIFTGAINSGSMGHGTSIVVDESGNISLSARGSNVLNTGVITTSSEIHGGEIVTIGQNVTNSGEIYADAIGNENAQAGAIELHSIETTELVANSVTSANAVHSGLGGDIKLLGQNVGLLDEALVEVSGAFGGGELLIGGDRTGENPNIRNADFVYVGENTAASVDGLIDGDGGKLITFSNDTTRIYGDLTARGGEHGGDGGFIETSGLRGFDIRNAPIVDAPMGGGGEWLIDPFNITIVAGSGASNASSATSGTTRTYVSNGGGAEVGWDSIENFLDGGGGNTTGRVVRIETGVGETEESGDIVFDLANGGETTISAVLNDNSQTGSLRNSRLILDAHNNIEFENQSLSVAQTGDLLHLELYAGNDILFTDNSVIDLGGGSFTATSRNFTLGSSTSSSSITTGGGDFSVTAGGDVTIFDSISSGGGTLSITGNSFTNTGEGISGANTLTINSATTAVLGSITTSSGALTVNSNSAITQGSGFLSVAGLATFNSNWNDGNATAANITLASNSNSFNNGIRVAQGHDVELVNAGTITLGASGQTFTIDGTLSVTALAEGTILDDSALQVTGAATFNAEGNTITLNNDNDFQSSVHVTGSNVTLNDATDNLQLGDSSSASVITGALSATTVGSISQAGSLVVTNATTLTAGSGQSIDVSDVGNVFSGTLSLNAQSDSLLNVSVADTTALTLQDNFSIDGDLTVSAAGIVFYNTTVGRNLIATATGNGTITDAPGYSFDITGTSFFTALGNEINLSHYDDNIFGGVVTADSHGENPGDSGGNITLAGQAITVGNVSSYGADNMGATGGGAGTVTVYGTRNTSSGVAVITQGEIDAHGGAGDTVGSSATIILRGDGGDNSFNINSGTSWQGESFTVNGLGGNDTFNINTPISNIDINGGDNSDSFNIGAAVSGDFLGGGGVDTFNIDASAGNLSGEDGEDHFNLRVSGVTADIDGGNNNDTITVSHSDNSTWLLESEINGGFRVTDQSRLPGRVDFENIDALVGNNANDTFTVNENFGGTITANNGVNTFNLNANVTGLIQGGSARDEINVGTVNIILNGGLNSGGGADEFNLAYNVATGTLSGGDGADQFDIETEGISIASIDGGGNGSTDVINIVHGDNSSWTLNGSGTYETVDNVNFQNIETANGGSGRDTFSISSSADVISANGLGGDDTFNLTSTSITVTMDGGTDSGSGARDVANYSSIGGDVTVNLGSGSGTVSGVETYIGNGRRGTTLNRSTSAFDEWSITDITVDLGDGDIADGVNDGTISDGTNTISFVNFGQLDGGSSSDQFTLTATGSFSGTIAGGSGGVNELVQERSGQSWTLDQEDDFSGEVNGASFEQIQTIQGSGSDSLEGRDKDTTWTLIGSTGNTIRETSDTDGSEAITFSGMSILTGNDSGNAGDKIDRFVVTGDFGGTINAGEGNDRFALSSAFTGNYNGQDNNDIFIIASTAANGSVFGGAGNNTLEAQATTGTNAWSITGEDLGTLTNTGEVSFQDVSALVGSTGIDTFTFGSGGVITGSIDGGATALNTITGRSSNTTWTLTDRNTGYVVETDSGIRFVQEFENIHNLTGLGGTDVFSFNRSSTAEGSVSGTITGGGGDGVVDSISYAQIVGTVSINLSEGLGSSVVGVESLEGNGANSTLQGADVAQEWNISDTNTGSVGGVNFSGFANLIGGSDDDSFIFTEDTLTAGRLTGRLTGGGQSVGGDGDEVNFSGLTQAQNISFHATTGNVSGIENIIGNDGSLTGDNAASDWYITGANTGSLNNNTTFSNISSIIGGSSDDTFIIQTTVPITMTMSGGGHSNYDTVNLSGLTNNNITVGSTIYGVTGIERVIGDGSSSTLNETGTDSNTWAIDGENRGSVDGFRFVGFNRLVGGSGDDAFNVQSGGSITGYINGATDAGGDTVTYSDSVSVTAGRSAAENVQVFNVEQITANASSGNTLTAHTDGTLSDEWIVDSSTGGTLNGVAFTGFNALVGSNNNDRFTFQTNFGGTIDAGEHDTRDTADYSQLATVSVILGSTGVDNVERLVGAGATSTLSAVSGTNSWEIDGLNRGSVGEIEFEDFGNLTGGSGDDSFEFTRLASGLGGTITGGAQGTEGDSVVYRRGANVDVQVGAVAGAGIDVVGIESIEASGSGILRGVNGTTNAWGIDESNGGDLGAMAFTGFDTLFGGDGDDTFTFYTDGSITNTIDAGGHSSRDTVNVANVANANINLSNTTIFGVTNVERVVGNGANNILTGANIENDWNITANNQGDINGLNFEGFNQLVGGSDDDTFDFSNGASVTGSVSAGAHDEGDTLDLADVETIDITLGATLYGVSGIEHIIGNGLASTLTMTASATTVEIDGVNQGQVVGGPSFEDFTALAGGAGSDTFTFTTATASIVSGINGYGESSEIDDPGDTVNLSVLTNASITAGVLYSNIETFIGNTNASITASESASNRWEITGGGSGSLNGVAFQNFGSLIGSNTQDDRFVFYDGGSISGSINGRGANSVDTVDVSNLENASITVGSTLFGVSNAERVVGDNSTTSITASNGAEHSWLITGENDGTIEGLSFVNVANLVGGDDDDSFTMTSTLSAITGSISGGGASTLDTLNYGTVTNVDVTLNQDVIDVGQITASNGILRVFNSEVDELNAWDIDGENTGLLNGTRFIGFNQLHGNGNDDTFTLRESANITGSMDAGGQQNRDTVNLSNLDTVAITLGSNVQGVTNAERIIGNGDDSTLTGSNSGQTWLITDSNTGSVGGTNFEDFNNITGGSGDDTFTVQAAGNISGEIDGGAHSEDGDAITFMTTEELRIELENDLTNIENVTGNGANSTLVGLDAGGSWEIDRVNSGTVSGVRFSQFATVEGGDGADTFSLTGGSISNEVRGGGTSSEDTVVGHDQENTWIVSGANAGSVDGINSFTGIEKLSGNDEQDTFTINVAFRGDIEGLGGNDIFNFHANTTSTVDGGDGNDEFILHQSGLTVSVDGEDGADSVEMRFADAVEWTINGGDDEQARDSSSGVLTFDDISIAKAGGGIDTFNISVSSATELRGGASVDIYNILSTEDLSIVLDGEAGADQLVAANRGNDWQLNQSQSERDNENANTLNGTIIFHRFEELDGSVGDDSFTVALGANIADIDGNTGSNTLEVASAAGTNTRWEINALNSGLVTNSVTEFSNIQNLIGGEGSDQFVLMNTAADISGLIDGNISLNTEAMADDSLDVRVLTDGVTIELGRDIRSDNLHVSGIETITAAEDLNLADNVDTEQQNSLISQRSESMSWTITERNSGRVDPTAGAQLEQQLVFSHFGNIQGGEGSDTFFLTGNGDVTGAISGGDGDGIDIANLSESTESLDFVIGGSLSVGTNISGLEGLIGNNNGIDADAPGATLRVASGSNTWTFENTDEDFIDALTDGINDGYFDDGSGGAPEFYFADFNLFEGGSGQDSFVFMGDASVTGTIDGGDNPALNPDTVDARQLNGNFVAQLGGNEFDVLNLNNVERILANDNEGRNNTLLASNENSQANRWVINGTNAGEINNEIVFDGFNHLTGGQGSDTFVFNAQDMIAGLIDGADGSDRVSLIDLADQRDITVAIGRDALQVSELNVVDVETIDANTDSQNTLVGNNRINTWAINGINGGELREDSGGSITFTGFENLTGGNQNDSFILSGSDDVTGLIHGGAEPDTGSARDILNISQLTRSASVTVGSNAAAGLSVTALEEINANGDFTNTLNADDVRNAWNIDAANSGQLNGLQFTAFSNIVGGNQNDTFTFSGSGAISHGVDGGLQEEGGQDIVDMALLSEVSVSIGESNSNGDFTGIERYTGNGRNSTLTAADQTNAWVFEGAENSGELNSVIDFEGFNNVVGGSERDTFTFNGGSLTGTISAGDGNDALVVGVGTDRSGEVTFDGQVGDDTVSITGGDVDYLTDYHATNNTNNNGGRLSYTHTEEATAYDVSFTDVVSVNDAVISETLTIHNVSGQADTLSLLNNAFVLNARTQIAYSSKNNVVVDGEIEDLVSIDGALSIDGRFEVQRAPVEMGVNGDRIRAQDVHFVNNDYIGRENNPVVLRSNNLSLDSIAGAVYIDEFDQLTITNFDRPNDVVSINAGGSITATTDMATANALRLVSRDGDIVLNNNDHALSGRLDFVASSGSVNITNSESLTLGEVSARNLTLNVEGQINDTADSDITVEEETRLTAQQANGETANINIGNGNASFSTLEIVRANAVEINDQSELMVTGIDADGAVNVNANGLAVSGHVQGNGIQFNGGAGAVGLQASVTSRDDLQVSGASFLQNSEAVLDAVTDISVNVNGSVVMGRESRSTSRTGNVTLVAATNINIASLAAETGEVVLRASTGSIADSNGDSVNVSAQRFEASAENGVGVNDSIELAVDRVMVNSSRDQIRLTNARALTVEHIRTNGNITLHVAQGDLTLDGSEIVDFDPGINDANTPGAVINANYNEGTVNISIDHGNLFALGELSQRQPDIVGREAVVFNLPQGEIGSSIRPLSIYVRDSLALIGFRSWAPEWAFRSRPSEYENSSTIQADARQLLQLVGELVLEVEAPYEINPAIFTDVRNFVHDAISIRMPSDQIYDLDDQDDEWSDDEYF